MCTVCRGRFPQGDLLRIRLKPDGSLTTEKNATGRSAYLCSNLSCKTGILQKRRLARAFKTKVDPDSIEAFFPRLDGDKG